MTDKPETQRIKCDDENPAGCPLVDLAKAAVENFIAKCDVSGPDEAINALTHLLALTGIAISAASSREKAFLRMSQTAVMILEHKGSTIEWHSTH